MFQIKAISAILAASLLPVEADSVLELISESEPLEITPHHEH